MKRALPLIVCTTVLLLSSCQWLDDHHPGFEKITSFTRIANLELAGGETAAEISAYDPATKRLFVINAVKSAIDVVNMEDPFNLVYESELSITAYGAGVNSVSVKNGLLAAAVESDPKTSPGKIVIWKTEGLTPVTSVTVGALPDMVAFSNDGKFIVSANEGEPNEDYTIDPIGSVSIIRVPGFSVKTLDFTSFERQAASLIRKGFRLPGGDKATFAADIEPEYVAISQDSKKAWVTLQENNGIATIDLQAGRIESIFPLGFKDFSRGGNEIDPSDRDNTIALVKVPVKGVYMPDGIASFKTLGMEYVITANEGDSRLRPTGDDVLPGLEEGDIFNEEERIKDVVLDPRKFPNAAALQKDASIGRQKITNTMGDTDGDGDYDELYAFGGRSFTIRNSITGHIVYESGNQLERFLLSKMASAYDDDRSDDKGVEPESVATGRIGPRTLAFVGLERADALVILDVTTPSSPIFLQVVETGDAPEGVLFIPADESPNGKSLVVTSCEGDGTIQVFALSGDETNFLE